MKKLNSFLMIVLVLASLTAFYVPKKASATACATVTMSPSQQDSWMYWGNGTIYEISVDVVITNVTNMLGWEFGLFWNNQYLNCDGVVIHYPSTWQNNYLYINVSNGVNNAYNSTNGYFSYACAAENLAYYTSNGSTTIATFTFHQLVKVSATTPLSFDDVQLCDEWGNHIDCSTTDSSVTLHTGEPITREQGNARGASYGSTIAMTLASSPSNGNMLVAVIAVQCTQGDTVTNLTEAGVTWAKAVSTYNYASQSQLYIDSEIWYGVVGSGASSSITVCLNVAADNGAVADVCEYSGMGAVYVDQTSYRSGNSISPDTGAAISTQANELWIGATAVGVQNQTTPTNGFTLLNGTAWNNVLSNGYLECIANSTGSAETGTSLSSSSWWAACIVTFVSATTLLTYNSKYVVTSTTANSTTSTSLQDDAPANQTFTLSATQTVLVIYQANNVYGAPMTASGMENAISIDGTDHAFSWDSTYTSTYCVRNCVFWIGILGNGSHTVKGRFASTNSGSTVTISNRVLLIYIFNGNEFLYTDDSNAGLHALTSSSTTFGNDTYAQFTFEPTGNCKALCLYNVANKGSGATESIYGKKIAIDVNNTDYGQAEKSVGYASGYADSVFTCHALSLGTTTTSTVRGRFANAGTAATVTVQSRSFGVLLLADSTLMDVVTSTSQVNTTSSSLVNDTQALITRTTTDTRELLVIAVGTKRSGTSSNYKGECYGIMINTVDYTNSRGNPYDVTYANSAATAYAITETSGAQTVQGRFSDNAGTNTAVIDARQVVALWFSTG